MKKFIYFLLATMFLFTSCDKDSGPNIDTSKAIRDGNFLQAADFKSTSDLKIVHSDKNVIEKIEKGVASFHYTKAQTKSTYQSDYIEQTTQINLYEDILVEYTPGTYILEFSYCFALDNPDDLKYAVQNVYLELYQQEISMDEDIIPGTLRPLQIGSGGDVPMNDKWSTYRTELNINRSYYANINFQLKNTSKVNNNTFFIRNIQLVKK